MRGRFLLPDIRKCGMLASGIRMVRADAIR
jgi:hypothetical protein